MSSLPRCAGVMTPLFALRQKNDSGIGDLGALKKLIDWCSVNRLRYILTLPVNACGQDYSPYNAISSIALEPLYLDLSDVDLFQSLGLRLPKFLNQINNNTDYVNYKSVSTHKNSALLECFEEYAGSWEFSRFCERNKHWLDSYALFRALSEKFHGCNFSEWPKTYRSYALAALIDDRDTEKRADYHKFCQWICDHAWRATKRYAEEKNVLLLGDLPFSISRQSADVWHHPERFSANWNAGAPPEPSFQDDDFVKNWGQNWGLPLYDWKNQESQNHPWWRDRLGAMARYFHGYRLDHALGYFRVYAFPWNPSENDKYIGKNQEQVLAEGGEIPKFIPGPDDQLESKLINLEHGRRFFRFISQLQPRLITIAEDLGMVPDYVRPLLEEISIPGMKIPQFERLQPDLRYLDTQDYPECSMTTWATHDHPPLAALWQSWQKNRSVSGADDWEIHCFLNFIGIYNDNRNATLPDDIHLAAIKKISTARSNLLCLQLTDWFALNTRYNVPGVLSNTNWSTRLPFTVEELQTDEKLVKKSQAICQILDETRRL